MYYKKSSLLCCIYIYTYVSAYSWPNGRAKLDETCWGNPWVSWGLKIRLFFRKSSLFFKNQACFFKNQVFFSFKNQVFFFQKLSYFLSKIKFFFKNQIFKIKFLRYSTSNSGHLSYCIIKSDRTKKHMMKKIYR